MTIRVMIADDNEIIRSAIVGVLKRESRIEVVGEAASFQHAREMAATIRPDVLLLDLHMRDNPRDSGIFLRSEFVRLTKCIIAISMWNDEATKKVAASLGAIMLLDKAELGHTLVPAFLDSCPQTRPGNTATA